MVERLPDWIPGPEAVSDPLDILAYEADHERGGLRLTADAVAFFDDWETRIAAKDAEIARKDERLTRMAAERQVRAALIEAGVPMPLLRGATAQLMAEWEFVGVDDADAQRTAFMHGPFGSTPVAQAVAAWVASPEGGAFLPSRPATPGPTALAIRRLH